MNEVKSSTYKIDKQTEIPIKSDSKSMNAIDCSEHSTPHKSVNPFFASSPGRFWVQKSKNGYVSTFMIITILTILISYILLTIKELL